MAELNQKVAQHVVSHVRPTNRQQAKALKGVKAPRSQTKAVVRTQNSARVPFAIGAFFGARRYAQFPEWIGNQWDAGDSVDGRYGVPFAIARELPEILDIYGDGLEELAAKAFPQRRG